MKKICQAAEFKAHCLEWIDKVHDQRIEIVITKRKIPFARLVPIETKKQSAFGRMEGTGKITGDIMSSIDEEWNACT